MAKKEETAAAPQGCLGTECSNGTCLACQVAQAATHHAEVIAVAKAIDAHLGDVAKELTSLRNAVVDALRAGPGALPALGSKAERKPAEATPPAPHIETPKAETKPAEVAKPAETKAETKLTIDAVRPKVLEWIKAHGRDKLVAILAKFGAAKLPDIKDADLPRFVAELDAAAQG